MMRLPTDELELMQARANRQFAALATILTMTRDRDDPLALSVNRIAFEAIRDTLPEQEKDNAAA